VETVTESHLPYMT